MLKSLYSFSIHISQKENNLVLLVFFQMCVVAVILFLVAWMPFTIYFLIISIQEASTLPALFHVVPAVFAKTSTCYNPVIYAIVNKRFRIAIQKTILCEKNVNDLDCMPMRRVRWKHIYISNTEGRARKLTLSLTVEHAQWWIFLLLSTAISFRFKEKKTHLGIKTSLFYTVVYFWGTASLISFVLPFSDNHFSK